MFQFLIFSTVNFPILHVEDAVVERRSAQYLVEVVAIGIGDEYLSEVVAGYQTHYLLYSLCIELVEDVVEQQ